MCFKKKITLFFVSFCISQFAFAQQTPVKTDSTHLYKTIETYSKRSKFGSFMYKLIFKPVAIISKKKVKRKVYKKLIQKPYSAFEGKTIRHINIETLDPFGYSIADTLVTSQNFLFNAGNKLHVKSQHITIRNLLLIRENQVFDSLLVKESERLVRSRGYVHDVSFYIKAPSQKSDSVDIFIRELDNWSLVPEVIASTSRNTIILTDKNFLGFGHEFQNAFTRNFRSGINSFKANYYIPNFKNTYIGTMLNYDVDGYGNFNKSLAIDRPFYTPFAKWAAGVSFASQLKKDSLRDINSVYAPVKFKFNTQDYWAGKALQIFKGNTEEERVTNLIMAMRYLHVRYFEKPSPDYDPLHIYSSENFFLARIGISTRKYVQDRFIFNHGVIEDVPVGKVYGFTGGYQYKNNSWRRYLGMQFSFGNYNEWGYLSGNFEYGTFFHASHTEQGVLTAGANYFSGLFEIGKWKFRQFVKPQVAIGINSLSYDSLTLNNEHGLDGFNSTLLTGTRRLLLTLQTQSYAPWKFIGFRFGPYLTFSMGMLGDAQTGFKNRKVYSQIGLGVLIKNENLVINTFQISIAFYPIIPGKGSDIFKFNSFRTTDFGFRDFEIGKPTMVVLQ
ncbi:MAG: hypothetical protein Q8928_05275 [Bacteroidota bacterium]|nr:hypothetical protein [Bacteroidota bacterium]